MAGVVTYSDFVARYPEFATDSAQNQTLIQTYLDEAEEDSPISRWGAGTRRSRYIKALAAHRWSRGNPTALSESGGKATGEISSLSVSQGSQSISFSGSATGSGGDSEGLSTTPYGQDVLQLRKQVALTGFVT